MTLRRTLPSLLSELSYGAGVVVGVRRSDGSPPPAGPASPAFIVPGGILRKTIAGGIVEPSGIPGEGLAP